jgi:hypothetical protein
VTTPTGDSPDARAARRAALLRTAPADLPLPGGTTRAEVMTSLDRMAAESTTPPPAVSPDADRAPDPATPAAQRRPAGPAPEPPPGYTLVPTAELEQLRSDADRAASLAHDAATARQRRLVEAAVADGRLVPRDTQRWITALSATPDMETALAAMPKVHDFGGPELGHGGDNDTGYGPVDPVAALWPEDDPDNPANRRDAR